MGLRELTRPVPATAAEVLADLDLPRERDLTPAELERLTRAVAERPGAWEHLVGFDDEERVFAALHRDAHVDVWLLCWTPQNDTGWHDHDVSCGAVSVVRGELVENTLTLGDGARECVVAAGSTFSFETDHIHRLNGAVTGSVSVHAYSPPLWRMGQYRVDEGGLLKRVSRSYADELRPID